MTTRRSRLVLVLVVLGVAAVGVFAWEPIWETVRVKRVLIESSSHSVPRRGFGTYLRWSGRPVMHGLRRMWNPENGLLKHESTWHGGGTVTYTTWGRDGKIHVQAWDVWDEAARNQITQSRYSPPWLWGKVDQAEPSMPAWMKDDEQWQAALDAQD